MCYWLISTGKEREHNLQAGDNVEVCEGELINLQGKILSVDGNKITIMPKHEDLKVHTQLAWTQLLSMLLRLADLCLSHISEWFLFSGMRHLIHGVLDISV